jgi:hypothetical protein
MKPSVVATITLSLHDNGSLSVEGNIGDVHLALGMLDSARAAVSRRLGHDRSLIEVPNRDVIAPHSPYYPVLPEGDRN